MGNNWSQFNYVEKNISNKCKIKCVIEFYAFKKREKKNRIKRGKVDLLNRVKVEASSRLTMWMYTVGKINSLESTRNIVCH